MTPFFVPRGLLPTVWPVVKPMLADSIAREGLTSADEVLADLMLGTAQLWVAGEPLAACLTTQVQVGPRGRRMLLGFVGGEGPWAQMLDHIQTAADMPMRIEGRAGWERVLPGFKRVGVILERPAVAEIEA